VHLKKRRAALEELPPGPARDAVLAAINEALSDLEGETPEDDSSRASRLDDE
jgi:hypothetical protein